MPPRQSRCAPGDVADHWRSPSSASRCRRFLVRHPAHPALRSDIGLAAPPAGFPGWGAGSARAIKSLLLPSALPRRRPGWRSSRASRVPRRSKSSTKNFVRTARAKGNSRNRTSVAPTFRAQPRHPGRHHHGAAILHPATPGTIIVRTFSTCPAFGRLRSSRRSPKHDLVVIKDVVVLLAPSSSPSISTVDLLYLGDRPAPAEPGREPHGQRIRSRRERRRRASSAMSG